MRYIIILICAFCCTSCKTTDYGRQIPPTGVWTYQNSSFLHALVIEIDLFSDGTFSFRQASGDSKTMTRRYETLASGTYSIEERTILFTLSAPLKQPHTVPLVHAGKNAAKVVKGTMSEFGKEMTLYYFGPDLIFKWRSPS